MSTKFHGTVLIAFVVASNSSAHFPFIVPDGPNKATVVFSDSLKPDDKGVPVDKIANTKLSVITAGKSAELAWTHDKTGNSYKIEVPGDRSKIVVGTTDYGVLQRGESKPFLMHYLSKAILGPIDENATAGNVPLELVPIVEAGKLRFKVLADGKPLAKAAVTVLIPGEEKSKVVNADTSGLTTAFEKPGMYGAYVNHVTDKAGEQGGKKYEEIRRYATLVVNHGLK